MRKESQFRFCASYAEPAQFETVRHEGTYALERSPGFLSELLQLSHERLDVVIGFQECWVVDVVVIVSVEAPTSDAPGCALVPVYQGLRGNEVKEQLGWAVQDNWPIVG